jgi:hypothetical protein
MQFTSLITIPIYHKYDKRTSKKGDFEMSSVKGKKSDQHEAPLKGTWISLSVVFGVILFTYFVLYGLYMARV